MAPTLAQDFTQATLALAADTGPAFVYGANTSQRRYWNSAGNLVLADNNLPRLAAHAYDDASGVWVSQGLLINTEDTVNLCLKSNELDRNLAQWLNGGAVGTQNVTGPDGVANSAWTLVDNSTTGNQYIEQTITIPNSDLPYCMSIYALQDAAALHVPMIWMTFTGGTQVNCRMSFDPNLAVNYPRGGLAPATHGVEINGVWRRHWMEKSSGDNTAITFRIAVGAELVADPPDGVETVSTPRPTGESVFYGAQIEENDTPTSYVDTDTVAVTRDGDVLTESTLSWLDAAATAVGTFVVKGMFQDASTAARPLIQLDDDVDTNDRIYAEISATETIDAHTVHAADADGDAAGIDVITAGEEFQIGLAYSDDSLRSSVNGSQIVEGSPAALPLGTNPAAFRLGSDLTNGGEIFLKEIRYYDEARRDAKLVSPEVFDDVPTTARPSIIPVGDSHTAVMWRQIGATGTITTSAGVTTISLVSAHNAPIGTRVRLGLATTPALNGIHVISATPSSTSISFAAPAGAPASEAVVSEVLYFENDQDFAQCWVHWLQAFSQGRFVTGKHGALGGDDAGELLARVADSTSQGANRAIVMIGTNDSLLASSTDADSTITEVEGVVDAFLAEGHVVDLCTVPPFGSAYSDIANTTKRDFKINLNAGIRAYAAATANVNLLDVDIWLTDQGNVNKQAIAGVIGADGIHFDKTVYTSADRILGEYMSAFYDTWLGTFSADNLLPQSNADCITENPNSPNKAPNCTFELGSGSPPTGTGYTQSVGTGSATYTLEDRDAVLDGDTFGKNHKSALTGVSASSTHQLITSPTPFANGDLEAGKLYKARAAVTVNPGAGTTRIGPFIFIAWTEGGFQRFLKAGLSIITEPGHFVLETAPFIWPEGTSGEIFWFRSFIDGSAGVMDIEWGRLQLLELGGAQKGGGFLVNVGQLMG